MYGVKASKINGWERWDTVYGCRHWHGAKADSWFSHIAVEVPGEECKNEWCEPVSDEQYKALLFRKAGSLDGKNCTNGRQKRSW